MEDIKELKDNQLEKSSGGTFGVYDYIGKTIYRGDVFIHVPNSFGFMVATTVDIICEDTPVSYYIISRNPKTYEWEIGHCPPSICSAISFFGDGSFRFSQLYTNQLGYLLAGK